MKNRLLVRKDGHHTRLKAFILGVTEADGMFGITYDGDSYSPCSVAYDRGRNLGERMLRLRAKLRRS